MMDNYVEAPVYHDFNQSKFASIYRVKFKNEFEFVYVEYYNTVPTFDEFVKAVRLQCKIEDSSNIIVKDDKDCTIRDAITFAYYMVNVYNQQSSFFEVLISPRENANELSVVVPTTTVSESQGQEQLEPIYENPDKFFVYYLSKDLINFFKHQTQIICNPTGAVLIQKYHISATSNLEAADKKSIIQISANHLMLVKHNEPSIQDRTIWAKVICEVFRQFRDSNTKEFYFAVYNPTKGDGFLGNRVKLLMKTAKKAKENQAAIQKQSETQTTENNEHNSIEIDCDLQNLVNLMKVADVSTDVSQIIQHHQNTFSIRQHYRSAKNIEKLISEFPRFFDVDSLIDYDFAQLYPLSGLVTFTQDVQARILKIGQASNNYNKFPSTHKNLAQPLNALLHLILLLPPTSLGRGQKNRIKIEQAFPRLVKIHEVNQPLIDVTKENPESTPFIVVSGSGSGDNFHKNYYVVFENKFIKCQSAFNAIDIFFKVHYIFDAKFDSSVRHVLGFVGYYFYNIKNITPNPQMRLLNSGILSID